MATTVTGRDGRYRLDGFSSAGDYQIQLILPTGAKLTTDGLLDFHIASGGQSIRGLNFGLSLLNSATSTAADGSNGDFVAGVDVIFASGSA